MKEEDVGSGPPLEVRQSEKGCAMQSRIEESRPTGVTSVTAEPLNKKTKGNLARALRDQVKGVHKVHTRRQVYTQIYAQVL